MIFVSFLGEEESCHDGNCPKNLNTSNSAKKTSNHCAHFSGPDAPIVVVGNKADLPRQMPHEETEAVVLFDWENGYVECSAKVVIVYRAFQKYFKRLLVLRANFKTKIRFILAWTDIKKL